MFCNYKNRLLESFHKFEFILAPVSKITVVSAWRKLPKQSIISHLNQRCYQDQGVRDQDQDQTSRDQDQDQGGRDQDQDQQGRDQDQDLKKVVLIGLETKTRSRDVCNVVV